MMDLTTCFGRRESHSFIHGFRDHEKVMRALNECLPDVNSRNLVEKCIHDHFNEIQKRAEFEELFNIDISKFIACEQDEFYVDLDKLKCQVENFLKLHDDFYQSFVVQLREIFVQYQNK